MRTAEETMKELVEALQNHDWWYSMSDDHSAWQKGADMSKKIHSMIEEMEGFGYGKEAREAWRVYAEKAGVV